MRMVHAWATAICAWHHSGQSLLGSNPWGHDTRIATRRAREFSGAGPQHLGSWRGTKGMGMIAPMTDNVTSGNASAHRDHASSTTDRPIRVGIMTCSDRGARGERADVSGPTLHNLVVDHLSGQVVQYRVVPDERTPIEAILKEWADEHKLDLILTTGGTGLSPRDVTPDATRAICDREVPAIAQAMFLESLRITPYAMLTRATAGIRRRTLIVNLPGNPRAVQENFGAIAEVLPHAIDIIRGVDTHAAHAGHRQEQRGGTAQSQAVLETRTVRPAPALKDGPIAKNVGGPPC